MDAIIEGIFMFFFEALAEGFADLAVRWLRRRT